MLRLLALTLTRPELLNGPASMADATVVSQFRVPALLKVPLPEKFVMALALLVLTLKVLPDALLSVALFSKRSRPAVRLALLLLFQVRPLRTLSPAPLTVEVASVVSCPAPLTVPLLQLKSPAAVRLPTPLIVPLLRLSTPLMVVSTPTPRVPPLMPTEALLMPMAPVTLTVPPVTETDPLPARLEPAARLRVPLLKISVRVASTS